MLSAAVGSRSVTSTASASSGISSGTTTHPCYRATTVFRSLLLLFRQLLPGDQPLTCPADSPCARERPAPVYLARWPGSPDFWSRGRSLPGSSRERSSDHPDGPGRGRRRRLSNHCVGCVLALPATPVPTQPRARINRPPWLYRRYYPLAAPGGFRYRSSRWARSLPRRGIKDRLLLMVIIDRFRSGLVLLAHVGPGHAVHLIVGRLLGRR